MSKEVERMLAELIGKTVKIVDTIDDESIIFETEDEIITITGETSGGYGCLSIYKQPKLTVSK